MHGDAAEERSIHRFEAFSDIVIGFSLAQLGASLTIPANSSELFTHPLWLVVFFWAFAMICAMWWFHHRFFATLFRPVKSMVLVNFVWLAVVVLCVYSTQLSVHFPSDVAVWRMYFLLFALAYGLLALQYRIGLRSGIALAPQTLLVTRRAQAFMTLWTMPFAVCTVAMFVLPWSLTLGFFIDATFIATSVCSGLLARRFRKMQARLAAA